MLSGGEPFATLCKIWPGPGFELQTSRTPGKQANRSVMAAVILYYSIS